MAKTRDGVLTVAIGASRSGKTAYVEHKTEKARRLLVWDIEGQYKGVKRVRDKRALLAILKKHNKYAGRIAYTGNLSDFEFFCKCAYWWACEGHKAGLITTVIAEETADVTSPNKAPPNWGILIRRGLKRGCDIFAVTQRPAESDKTAIGNAGVLHVCRVNGRRDAKTVSDYLGVSPDEITALHASQESNRFDYIERDQRTGKTHKGFLTFEKNKPKFKITT